MSYAEDASREKKEQSRYDELAAETSESLAYFYCCIAFDVPFDRDAVPNPNTEDRWLAYRDNLRMMQRDMNADGSRSGFLDGLTDILKIFGEGLKSGEFTKSVSVERSAKDRKQGTARQRKNWGQGSEEDPITTKDYNRLDELFDIYSKRLESAGGYDAQQEHILRLCCKLNLKMDKALSDGAISEAQKLNKMIQDNLASENLRKKDAKPIEDIKLDSIVDSLEKAGLLKNGKQCDPDKMFQILFGRPPKYAYTRDAADQMILINENRMRNNDGMPELTELPDDMRLVDDMGEFAEEQSPREKEAYGKLGLVKMPPVKKSEKRNG